MGSRYQVRPAQFNLQATVRQRMELRINEETAAMLYLALCRYENAVPGSCDCADYEDHEKCIQCQSREALNVADGGKRKAS